jgi:hypothetical protein
MTRKALTAGLDKVVRANQAPVETWIRRARRGRLEATPAEIISSLENQFRAAVSTMGAVSGAAAAAPGISTGVGLATAPLEIATFLEATAVFAQAVAEIHGVHIDDVERRRTLILAVAIGGSGATIVEQAAGRTGAHWGRQIVKGIPMSKIHAINKALGRNFVTKYGTKQGILVLGRAVPLGVGALIGAGGNAVLAQTSIKAARRAFGPPPEEFPLDELFLATEPSDGDVIIDAEIVSEPS